jgi:hypothetical protein
MLPADGAWGSWLSGYGGTDWFEFTAQANRTASVAVIAVDESGAPTENKLLPVIGIWQLSDQTGNPAPASTPSAFNTAVWGMSRLDAQFGVTGSYKIGVADFRGDGRPDFFYKANVLYSDTVTPSRLSLAGGLAALHGIGFNQRQQVVVGGNNGSTLSVSANRIEAALPGALNDGSATIQVTDPVTGAFSQMIGALNYGAEATDLLLLLRGSETATPVGAVAASPLRVRVVAADGVTPVSGATIAWSSTNGLTFSTCHGSTSCSVLSDEMGQSASMVTPTVAGVSTITIALAPASYPAPQTQQATVLGVSSVLDLAAINPTRWIAQGATVSTQLLVEALSLGVPKSNVALNFAVTRGTASLSATSATTGGSGYAAVTANITNQNGDVQVLACVSPNNTPCQTFTLFSTPASLWKLETASGSSQFILSGESFQPLRMRVTDGSTADNPVMGVNVIFSTTLAQISSPNGGQGGETIAGGGGMPVILGQSQAQLATDVNGLASIVPSTGNVGPCDVFITVRAGANTAQFQMESQAAIVIAHPTKIPKPPAEAAHDAPSYAHAIVPPPNVLVELYAVPDQGPIDILVASPVLESAPASGESCPEKRQKPDVAKPDVAKPDVAKPDGSVSGTCSCGEDSPVRCP